MKIFNKKSKYIFKKRESTFFKTNLRQIKSKPIKFFLETLIFIFLGYLSLLFSLKLNRSISLIDLAINFAINLKNALLLILISLKELIILLGTLFFFFFTLLLIIGILIRVFKIISYLRFK